MKAIFGDPRAIAAGVVAGFLVGYSLKPVGAALAPYGAIYVALLAMCILPMMTCAIVAGLGHMLRSPHTRGSFRTLALGYVVGLLVPGLVGIAAAAIGQPGVGIDLKGLANLGEVAMRADSPDVAVETGRLLSFLGRIVPHNVFAAYSEGRVVSIIFVSVLAGVALGLSRAHKADDVLHHLDVAYEIFERIFAWVIKLLPFGLFCVIAGLASTIDPGLVAALLRYIAVFCATALLLLVSYHCLLWALVGGPFSHPLRALKEPLLVAFLANTSIITIPSCLDALKTRLGADPNIAELVVPFGIIANRHGVVLLFAYTTVFVAQIYGVVLDASTLSIAYVGSTLSGMAAEGHGAAIAPLLNDVLVAVGVPAVLGPIVLTVAFPIVGRLENLLTIYATAILAIWVGGPKRRVDRGAVVEAPARERAIGRPAALSLILLGLLAAAPVGRADAQSSFPELRRIADRKALRVAMIAADVPPFVLAERDGQLDGIDVRLARDIARELGVSLSVVRQAPTFDKVIESVARGEADLGISFLSVTPARAKLVYFSQPYLTLRQATLINRLGWIAERKKLNGRDIRDTALPVGALRESAAVAATRAAFPRATLREFGSFEEMVAAVERGDILAALDSEVRLKRHLKVHPEGAVRVELRVLDQSRDPIAIAVRPDGPQLLAWINTYLAVNAAALPQDDALLQLDR